MYGGVVLAAGASTRLGAPKALVPIQGEPAVARVVRLLRAAGCDDVVVVLGADEARVRPAVPPSARPIVNQGWPKGQTSSVKAGVAALDRACCLFVWPVDRPAVRPETPRRLRDAQGDIVVPTFQGRRGHPVLFEARLREEILGLRDDEPLHRVVHARSDRVVEVPVDDPGILLNLDTPEDVSRVAGPGGWKPARAPS